MELSFIIVQSTPLARPISDHPQGWRMQEFSGLFQVRRWHKSREWLQSTINYKLARPTVRY